MEKTIYNIFQYLLIQKDVEEIILNTNCNFETLIINFKWIVDCGCFNIPAQSCLTIYTLNNSYPKIVNDINNKTGKIYQLISNYKSYTGELIDLREVNKEN